MDFQAAYTHNFRLVYRFLYYKDVDRDEIEDLVQEIFFRFYKKYDPTKMQDEHITKTLYIIARNVWREWLREITKNKTVTFIDEVDGVESWKIFTAENVGLPEWEKEREQLGLYLDKLNPVLRDVLNLRFIEGKTRQETAELLKMTEDRVHTYQKRGIKQLQKLLSAVPPLSHTY